MKDILNHFDESVIGQENPKKTLAAVGHNHFKRILSNKKGVKFQKNNVLFLGPTGSGKTLLAQTMADCLNLPFTIVDCVSIMYGYDTMGSVFKRLLATASGDPKLVQKGIIFLDEVDKLARNKEMQKSFLKTLEGTEVSCFTRQRDLI